MRTDEAPRAGARQVRFGTAELSRDPGRPSGWLLSVGAVAQSYVDIDDPTFLEFGYLRHIAVVLHCVAGPGTPLDAVHIGGAACTMPSYLAATRPGSRQLVVDADGELIDWMRAEFAIDAVPGLTVRTGDGRGCLDTHPSASADLVMLDAYERGSCVGGLVTVEATRQAARILRPGGIQVVNILDSPGLPFTRRVAATLLAVHPTVLLLIEPEMLEGHRSANVVLVGSAALPTEAIARVTAVTVPNARCLAGGQLAALRGIAQPLTDQAPADGPDIVYSTAACC